LEHGIRPGPLEDPAVLAITRQTSLTPAQVLLARGIQRGTAVLTTAKTLRARENLVCPKSGSETISFRVITDHELAVVK
jgi:diketogulonate reductase-like aldo/keto reductase